MLSHKTYLPSPSSRISDLLASLLQELRRHMERGNERGLSTVKELRSVQIHLTLYNRSIRTDGNYDRQHAAIFSWL